MKYTIFELFLELSNCGSCEVVGNSIAVVPPHRFKVFQNPAVGRARDRVQLTPFLNCFQKNLFEVLLVREDLVVQRASNHLSLEQVVQEEVEQVARHPIPSVLL